MVIESLKNPFEAEKKPWTLFLIGIIYSTIGIFLANRIFQEQASIVMVFFIVMACIPLLYSTIKKEEKKDITLKGNEKKILKEHSKAIAFLTFLFIGCTISLAFWYVVMPSDFVSNSFDSQVSTIREINGHVTGSSVQMESFSRILSNNLKVLVFCVIFSFLYGAGAIFIIIWNSSVIAAAIGNVIRHGISSIVGSFGFTTVAQYFNIFYYGVGRYFFHGIPEMIGYFIGGLAGGIISVAVIREGFFTKDFEKVIYDAADLILIAVLVLIVAAFMEVYMTPIFFPHRIGLL